MPLQDRYVNPLTDFGFKKLFGSEPNKDLLIHFLNQLLPEHHQIQDLTYLSTEKLGFGGDDRRAIFDLYCTSTSGERFIVEVQKAKQKFFRDRSVFYATFPIQEQAKKGDWDFKLEAVYLIAILDFVFDEDLNDPTVRHEIQLKDQKCKVFYDKLTFIYIELPKFTKREEELQTTFDKWLYVLKHLPNLEDRPRALQERVFQRLFEAAEIARFNPEERQLYEENLKVYRDLKNVVDTAKDEGKAEGRAEGHAEGRAEKAKEVVLSAYTAGLDLTLIAQISELSAEEVRAILREAGYTPPD